MTRHKMDAGDAAWLHMDRPTNRMIVNSVMWFDEPLDWDAVRILLQERLIDRFPRFSQRVVETVGSAWWEDVDDLTIDDHLVLVSLPAPGDQLELQRYVSQTLHEPLDIDGPLWQLHFIDGYRGRGSAIVARIHHCIADGIALSRVMMSLTDDPGEAYVGVTAAIESPHVSLLSSLVHRTTALGGDAVGLAVGLAQDVVHPSRAVDLVEQSAAGARTVAKLLALPPDAHTSLRGKAGVFKSVMWTDPIALGHVTTAAHESGVTVNDLVLSAVSGALRVYLAREDGHAPDIRAIVPVNLRAQDQPLPAGLGNKFGLIYLQLPVSIDDRDERLAEVHRRGVEIKNSIESMVTFGALDLIGHTPYGFEQLLVDLFANKGTAVMTNVAGPRSAFFLAGRKIRGTIGWPPESGNLALGISIISYDGELTIGLMCDDGLVHDPRSIMAEIQRELHDLMFAPPEVVMA